MVPPSPLEDPATAAHAWARYKRVIRWMMLAALAMILVAFAGLYWRTGFISIHLYIATALGIGLTMLLGAALMGLVFLSNGTGHDASVADQHKDPRA